MSKRWKIRVTYPDGQDAYLRHGSKIGEGALATFATRKLAEMNADFIGQGLDAGCVVAIVEHRKADREDPPR